MLLLWGGVLILFVLVIGPFDSLLKAYAQKSLQAFHCGRDIYRDRLKFLGYS